MATPADTHIAPRVKAPASTLRRWVLFVAIGLLLYLALYAWAEWLARTHAESNRFYQIHAAPPATYDNVILGASHAMPLAYGDMNTTLEEASGTSIMNLSIEGGGILPARFLLDYFLTRHEAEQVIIFLDSFAFYSAQWNEERLADPGLFQRAPFDPALAATMWEHPWARDMLPWYVSGFHKINNENRFAPDIPEGATKFDRVYRPIPQIDEQRIGYLYPPEIDQAVFDRYLGAFTSLIERAREAGAQVVVVKPPTPERYRKHLPAEEAFDASVSRLLDDLGVTYHDLSHTILDDQYYYDTDHLNREGVMAFAERDFLDILRR